MPKSAAEVNAPKVAAIQAFVADIVERVFATSESVEFIGTPNC